MDTHRKAVHTAERPFECPKCSKAFKKKSHLENHIVSHSDELKFKCPVCGKAFKSKARLCEHKLANHRDTVFKCSFCTRIFAMSKTLKKHMSEHIDGKPHVCYLCPHDDQKAYKSKFGLWYHIKNYHGDSKDKEPFECHVCKKLFTRAEVLESHLRTHEKPKEAVQKRYECDVCQMTFTRNYSLKLHGVRHITEKNFKCELCSKLFRGADQLRRHLKLTHSGECSCIICGDIFANRYALRKHDYTLHKDFTLKCHLCPHRFATKESRLDHVISMHSMAKSDAENCLESETTSKSDCEIVEHAEETLESIIVKTEYEIN
ncbi:Zinc finger C2H2 superfamily [Sergentomyia squamirostris]